MSVTDTFWLTMLGHVQLAFIFAAFISAMMIPKVGTKDVVALQIFLFITLFVEVVSTINIYFLHQNFNLLFNISDIVGLPLGIWFYRQRISNFSKLAAGIIISLFVCLGLINLFFFQGLHAFNSYTSTIGSIGFIGLSIMYSFVLLQRSTHSVSKLGIYWINAAILFYYAGTFWLLLLVDYLVRLLNSNLIILWMMHHSVGLVFYGLLCVGLVKLRREYLSRTYSI